MPKTKIAIFDLTGCQGCEFNLLSLNEALLDFSQDFEITNWRLLQKDKPQDFDIALIEGAVTTKAQVDLVKKIRKTTKILVAFGVCAISGNIFAELSSQKRKKLAKKIYAPDYKLKAQFLKPVREFVKVDKEIPGCPAQIEKVKEFLKEISLEKITSTPKVVPSPEYLAKIEGHGTLKVNFRLKKVSFEVEESERLVEGLVLGKPYHQAPFVTSRICGICPIAHNLCSWKAIENALGITPLKETILLREILLASQIIKSHLLHLFFLVLPHHANLTSSLELAKKYPAEFHLMLNIKRVTDQIAIAIGGEILFPSNTTLGGFLKVPSGESLFSIRDNIWQVIDEAQDLVKLFASFHPPNLKVHHQYLTINQPTDFPLYQGILNHEIFLKEKVILNSPAKLGFWKDKPVRVGALARINLFHDRLNPKAKEIMAQLNLQFPSTNPFHNNLAQAIEILHFLEEIIKLVEITNQKDLTKTKGITNFPLPEKEVSGVAIIEAPRGILLHQILIAPNGKIKNYSIITPTILNLTSLQKETRELIKQNDTNIGVKQVEALVWAFDPCITCAVH